VTFDEFKASLGSPEPPPGLDPALQALWWDAQGNWERAHTCVQANEADPISAWGDRGHSGCRAAGALRAYGGGRSWF